MTKIAIFAPQLLVHPLNFSETPQKVKQSWYTHIFITRDPRRVIRPIFSANLKSKCDGSKADFDLLHSFFIRTSKI